ncbi:hypothetical protein [uncultured Victivallis sp.]|uniref:hypothetical protein n=1 Tax=uncultured Victivallis sp. TaxID=354118 RepID=UPI0025FB44B8|nr:hypothetical protein [uncultured Victivallis sp.]
MMQELNTRLLTLGGAGMRGKIGSGLTPGAASDFAAAFASFTGAGKVLVGSDPRTSSGMLKCAVTAALAGGGCEVIDGGVLTAGLMHFLIPAGGYAGGILITGGHQAAGWNALIPLASDGSYFDPLRQRELFDLYLGRRFAPVRASEVKAVQQPAPEELEAYWTFLERNIDVEAVRKANLTLLGDFCNGSGARFAKRFASLLGVRLIGLNDVPCGTIPRDPEPRPRTASPIRSIVEPLGAAVGLVFNSDLSRMGIVTDSGEPLSEELTYPLAADYLLGKLPAGTPIVTNVCTSRSVDDVAARHGATLERARVGQAAVIDLARSTGAGLAGEGSGSFTTAPLRGFDGFLMAGLILESIAVRGVPLSEQLASLPRYEMVKQAIPVSSPNAYSMLRRMIREFGEEASVSELDGLRFDWPDGFLSLRLSSTEAALRLISESKSRETALERAWRARLAWERL